MQYFCAHNAMKIKKLIIISIKKGNEIISYEVKVKI